MIVTYLLVVWDMVVTRSVKNLCRRLIKQGRKVNSNKITKRRVMMGRSYGGEVTKNSEGAGTLFSQKMRMVMGKIEASVV
jgi:hypothetical protein